MEVEGTCDKVLAGSIAKQQEGQQVHSSPSKPITVYSRIAQPLPPSLDRCTPAGPACSKLHNFWLYRFLVIQQRETITCFSTNMTQTGFVLATDESRISFLPDIKSLFRIPYGS